MKKILIYLIPLTIAFLVFGFIGYQLIQKQNLSKINDFESCSKAGYPIMESYPERCATPDGISFTRVLTDEEKKNVEPPISENLCGNGTCEEIVCLGTGCPIPETKLSCPQDCK